LLSERSVEAAPAELAATLAKIRIPVSAGLGAGGALALLLSASKAKLAAGVVVALLVAGTTMLLVRSSRTNAGGQAVAADPINAANEPTAGTDPNLKSSNSSILAAQLAQTPDPLRLLQGVARARQRIASGEIEMEVAVFDESEPHPATNRSRFKALFDDNNLRFESLAREYRYHPVEPDAAEATTAKMKAQGLSQEAAVKAGLLEGFESRHVRAYDGHQLLDYWETDGKPVEAKIQEASAGGSYIFDPRCLGITVSAHAQDTIAGCLGYANAAAVRLIGRELVNGIPAWRVRVQRGQESSSFSIAEFWIEISNPIRVLKHTWNGSTALSKYDPANPRDCLPIAVTELFLHGTSGTGTAISQKYLTRRSARFDVPIDPALCTLAGLGMKVGTDVVDYRISRTIGYWTGSGLSENLPAKTSEARTPPDRAELMAALERYPNSVEAFDAAQWILLNTHDGPDVEKARDVILHDHINSPELARLAQALARIRHPSCIKLLLAMLEKNPHAEVRGIACLSLATIRKDEAKYGKDKAATAEAQKFYERVISEFGKIKQNGSLLADLARPDLAELRRLFIGKPAPETEGLDLDGQPMNLSAYRGRVVVLTFWGACGGCRPEVRELRDLLDRFDSQPLSLLGVYCDDDATKARDIVQKIGITWPSFFGTRNGPIPTAWNNTSWPSTWVLDKKGVIRFREVRQGNLVKAVESLLKE
jgi:hypothetical protein